MTRQLLLVAAGGLAREVLQVARLLGDQVTGYVDDDTTMDGACLDGVAVLGATESATIYPSVALVLCAGHGEVRLRLAERLAALGVGVDRYGAVIHPDVNAAPSCVVGAGSIVLAGVVMTTSVMVGRHVVLMPNVTLTHDDVVEDYATVCAGVQVGGAVRIERGAYIGMGTVIREGLTVGAGAFVGMGSVVTRDVPPGQTWWGVPAAARDRRELAPGAS